MRLWHKDLIPVLPRQQLLGQWRECCLIAKNIHNNGTPNHLLVNKIMDYPLDHFFWYGNKVACEMECRGYRVNFANFSKWFFPPNHVSKDELFKDWHNDRYLNQCLANLQEKFDCGGIGICEYEKIVEFVKKKYGEV